MHFKTKLAETKYIRETMMKFLTNKENVTKNNIPEFEYFIFLAKDRQTQNNPIDEILVSRTPLNSFFCELKFLDGTKEPISFLKIIYNRGKDPEVVKLQQEKSYLNQSMRKEISSQIAEFKKNSILICENCKDNDKNTNYHVDHISKFKDLAEAFISMNPNLEIKMIDDKLLGAKKFILCEFSERWADFHKKNSSLRILCQSCNCRLGSKNDY